MSALRPRLAAAAPWLLFAVAAALRLPFLDVRPMHHDEGSNAIFVFRIVQGEAYRYDPSNYHGPLPYHLTALALAALGTTTVAFRIVPALLGALIAPLAWSLRGRIGDAGAFAAGLLFASSPSMVYYSRDNIHEIYLAFFTLAAVAAALRAAALPDPPGPPPRAPLLWWIVAGAAGGAAAATKETAIIAGGAIGGAALCVWGGRALRPGRGALLALVVGGAVAAAFYSSWFTDPAALAAPARALALWAGRAVADEGHVKPWWYFVALLAREEPILLGAGIAGAVLAARRRCRMARFFAVWSALGLAAHSAIPYKTPWLAVSLVGPLGLLGGWAAGALAGNLRFGPARVRRAAAAVALAGLIHAAVRSIDLAFVRPDVEGASRLVYVQTGRDALRLVRRLEAIAADHPDGRGMVVQILSPDYLPLNWYLREFTRVGYFGRVIEAPAGAAVVARADDADEVALALGPGYGREEFDLRPGVRLALFVAGPVAIPPPAP